MSGGWAVCPVCGAVVADTWAHTLWHETTIADVITDTVASHPTAGSGAGTSTEESP